MVQPICVAFVAFGRKVSMLWCRFRLPTRYKLLKSLFGGWSNICQKSPFQAQPKSSCENPNLGPENLSKPLFCNTWCCFFSILSTLSFLIENIVFTKQTASNSAASWLLRHSGFLCKICQRFLELDYFSQSFFLSYGHLKCLFVWSLTLFPKMIDCHLKCPLHTAQCAVNIWWIHWLIAIISSNSSTVISSGPLWSESWPALVWEWCCTEGPTKYLQWYSWMVNSVLQGP